MLRFALWSLRSRWTRIVTLCLGLISISICTTLLAGLAQLSTLSADEQLSRTWQSAPYDLLVRSPDALSPVERQLQMIDPSGPEQTYGGISLQQVSTISRIPHVAVAAPEAVIGWVMLRPYILITFHKPGLYRVTTELGVNGTEYTQLQNLYETLPLSAYREAAGLQERGKITFIPLDASGTAAIAAFWPLPTLLVGIDPGAEARLAGLRWQPAAMKSNGTVGLPLLMDTHPWAALTASITAEYSPLPDPFTQSKNGGDNLAAGNLDTYINIPSPSWTTFVEHQFDGKSLLNVLAQELSGKQQIPCAGSCEGRNVVAPVAETLSRVQVSRPGISPVVPLQGGGVTRYEHLGYTLMTSPVNANNAPPVLRVLSMGADAGGLLTRLPLLPETTTPWITFDGSGGSFTTFDSKSLPVLRNNISSWVASGLYEPEVGTAPVSLSPQHSIISLPPLLFTTVSAACELTGAECISAVRVRVAGVDSFSQHSEAFLQQVAADIQRRTGLHVDVLRGASGRQVEIQIDINGKSPGIFFEVWIQPHAAIAIANGVSGANVLLLLSEVSVAALALLAAALLAASSRKSELAILLRIGWSDGRILIESIIEAASIALVAGIPAWGLVTLLKQMGIPAIDPVTILYVLGAAVLLYIMICTLAVRGMLAKFVTRRGGGGEDEGLGTTGLAPTGSNAPWWLLMFYRQVSSSMGGIVLVVLAIMGASGLVSLMLLVYRGLDGLLYTTLLGEQVQITLSGIHLVTGALTCVSAALTAGLIILMMVRERKREFAMLLAIGWRGRTVAREVVYEGMMLGFLGGLLGGIVAVLVFLYVYQIWSPRLFIVCVGCATVLGMILCGLGALYPALLAGRLAPRQIFAQA
ncbi:MAG TPA: ABC transporter permease [Ktedonobacteraceae bacterium]